VARGKDEKGSFGMKDSMRDISTWIKERAGREEFAHSMTDLLFRLCELRTIPGDDGKKTAGEEGAVHAIISEVLKKEALPGRIENRAIDDGIAKHPAFTFPYYAGRENAYEGRSNLLHIYNPPTNLPRSGSVALNAHIDTVAPYFKPYIEGGKLYGRGACDDKGSCVAIIGALTLLEKLRREEGIAPAGRIVSMFVTDEESGGNGSLARALDKEVSAGYDTMLVVESTEDQLHPGNRGAVWYKAELGPETPESLRLALETVLAFEKLGKRIRAESDHPLFPTRPAQTCHGILGPFGEHPSRICGRISFTIEHGRAEAGGIRNLLETGLEAYIAEYGDRTKIIDPLTGKPKVDHHYDLETSGNSSSLTVWGTTGHMGSALENDGAITKAAWMLTGVFRTVPDLAVRLSGENAALVLEVGQGFLPTHRIEEIEAGMREAAAAACRKFREDTGYGGPEPFVSFDKLHNDAFDGPADSPEMLHGIAAAEAMGMKIKRPVAGFPVSCDAMLFAREHPDKRVITSGPGSIRFAHADNEHISIGELARSSGFFALYLLLLTGTIRR